MTDIEALAAALADMRVIAEALGSNEEEASDIGRAFRQGNPEWTDERAMLAALRAIAEEPIR